MILYKVIQRPVLSASVIIFLLIVYEIRRKGGMNRDNLNPTSCRSASVMLKKRMPADWDLQCQGNDLLVTISEKGESGQTTIGRALLYRKLAAHLVFISKNSLEESLERTHKVKIHLKASHLSIHAVTEGKYVSPMAYLDVSKLTVQLRKHVRVKETFPDASPVKPVKKN